MHPGGLRFKTVELRFYGDLVDFVPGGSVEVERTFDVSPSIKDMIEACGVPHPEVDMVLVDGEPVGWDHAVCDGERISVYPRFRGLDVSAVSPVHVDLRANPRFVLDGHLGKLARHLRLVGVDALQPDVEAAELAELAYHDDRALLTRHVELLKRSMVRHGYFVRASDPVLQCAEVVRYFDLGGVFAPFTRCTACNGLIESATDAEIESGVPPGVRRRHNRFRRCNACGRMYWEGSHYRELVHVVDTLKRLATEA